MLPSQQSSRWFSKSAANENPYYFNNLLVFATAGELAEAIRTGRLFGLIVGAFATPPTLPGNYLTALHQRDGTIAKWEQFFQDWDVLLCPVHNITAPHYSDRVIVVDGEELILETAASPADLSPASGIPSVIMPLSRDQHGLPIGVQVLGRRWEDERLLAVAELISEVTGGFERPPGY